MIWNDKKPSCKIQFLIEGRENGIRAFAEGKVSLAFDRSFGGQTTFILCEILEEHFIQHEEHSYIVRF